jgi:hypothetical protein
VLHFCGDADRRPPSLPCTNKMTKFVWRQYGDAGREYLKTDKSIYRSIQNQRSRDDWFRMGESTMETNIVPIGPDLPLVNPNVTGRLTDMQVLSLFETSDLPKVGGYIQAEDAWDARSKAALVRGPRTENVMIYPMSQANLFRVAYLVEEIRGVAQVEGFVNKFDEMATFFLMSQIARREGSACVDPPCSLPFDTQDPVGAFVREWIASRAHGVYDAIIDSICHQHATFSECACIQRARDVDYLRLAGKTEMSDACWYLPCKSSKTMYIPSDLQRVECPNVCAILSKFENDNNVTITESTRVQSCPRHVQPGPSVHPAPPVPTPDSTSESSTSRLIAIGVTLPAVTLILFALYSA